jgi:hypothetical protein
MKHKWPVRELESAARLSIRPPAPTFGRGPSKHLGKRTKRMSLVCLFGSDDFEAVIIHELVAVKNAGKIYIAAILEMD